MIVTIKAHFDGKVIVPDEPVDLPINQPLSVQLQPMPSQGTAPASDCAREALDRLVARAIHGLRISDEALRREHLYEDRT
jgi:hypothetical protein